MEQIKDILKKRKAGPVHAKYEFQEYGIWLSEQLHDKKHKTLYIKLAKQKPRSILEEARTFAIEAKSDSLNRGRLFMWKLGELEKEKEKKSET